MEALAKRLTNYILSKHVIKQEDYEIYRYGFQAGLEFFSCVVVCMIFAGYMGVLPECILLMMLFFTQRAYVDGIHMKKFWSCFLLSVSVILCGLILVKMLHLPDGGVCIVSLLCLMAVKKLSDKDSDYEEDMDAARYYSRQRKRINTLIVVFHIAVFALHYSRGLLIILYTEIVMLVSVLVKYRGKRKKQENTISGRRKHVKNSKKTSEKNG